MNTCPRPIPYARLFHVTSWMLVLALLVGALPAAATMTSLRARELAPAGAEILSSLQQLPLAFVPNAGQLGDQWLYEARAHTARLAFNHGEMAMAGRNWQIQVKWQDALTDAQVEARTQLPGVVNYLIGSRPEGWRTGLPTYAQIVYHDLYPGIQLEYEGREGELKGTYVIAPGADPSVIRWRYEGATNVIIDERSGDLMIVPEAADANPLWERAPIAWQEIEGRKVPVHVRYTMSGDGSIGFAVGRYDPRLPLIIDPSLQWSTYHGGGGKEAAWDITAATIASEVHVYLTGYTESDGLATSGAYDTTRSARDAVITKIAANGTAIGFTTYLGGSADDEGHAISVASDGKIFVVGNTFSSDFPTVNAYDETRSSSPDAFLAVLSNDGASLLYSTYLGGNSTDSALGVSAQGSKAYIAGTTSSSDFPTKNAYDTTPSSTDAFLTVIDTSTPGASGLLYSTYLGGSSGSEGWANVAADSSGNAYVVGGTPASDFPKTTGLAYAGGSDAFVTKIDTTKAGVASIVYSRYLGGSGDDTAFGVAIDSSGRAYVTGSSTFDTGTPSTAFPTTPNALHTATQGGTDAFMTKLSADGSTLEYSTLVGGPGTDIGYFGIEVDLLGRVYFAGTTHSSSFDTTGDAYQSTLKGTKDAFIVVLDPSKAGSSSLVYGTYFGGTGDEDGSSLALDASTNMYLLTTTSSSDYPLLNALDNTYGGNQDMGVSKFSPPATAVDLAELKASGTGSPWLPMLLAALIALLLLSAATAWKRRGMPGA